MNNATIRMNITKSAIETLKQTFLSVMHEFREQGETEFSPSKISKELGIPSDGNYYYLATAMFIMLVDENKVESISRGKYKLKG